MLLLLFFFKNRQKILTIQYDWQYYTSANYGSSDGDR